MSVFVEQRRQKGFHMTLIIDCCSCTPHMEFVLDYLTNIRLSDIYNLPGESVAMSPEIFSAMRAGNKDFLAKMRSYGRTMARQLWILRKSICNLDMSSERGFQVIPTSGMTLRSRSEHHLSNGDKYKDNVNALLLVATLVATVAFAAGFTVPGGFSSSPPNLGMAILANELDFCYFLLCNTLAMQCSVVAIVALIWAQLGDPELIHRAFHLALPSLFVALISMSAAFLFGVVATRRSHNNFLFNVVFNTVTAIFFHVMVLLLGPYVIPQLPGVPFL